MTTCPFTRPRALRPPLAQPAAARALPSFPRRPGARRLACAAAVLLLGACGALVQTPYETPATNAPAQWTGAAGQPAASPLAANADDGARAGLDGWWHAFGDPDLDRLIEAVLARNNDLAAATIKLRRARLEAGLAADQLVPSIDASASAGASRNLSGERSTTHSYSASVGVSYEADLWGRLAGLRDQAQWEAQATEQDRAATALTLVGTAADLYWNIAYLNRRVALSEESIAYADRTQQLVQAQYKAGAASSLELQEARQTVAAQRASHAELLQTRTEDLNALAILLDGPPGTAWANPQRLPESEPPEVAAGLPAELLGRRPDLRAAELRLRAALGNVDTTRVSYYPTLSLTGSLGSASTVLRDVLSNPVAALGAGLVLPFVQYNEMRLNVQIAQADYELAVVDFRQTLYAALADVENALSARTQYAAQGAQLAEALDAARTAERLYEARYRAGSVALRTWLDAQESRRSAEASLAQNQLARLTNQVTLYQALGGSAALTAGRQP